MGRATMTGTWNGDTSAGGRPYKQAASASQFGQGRFCGWGEGHGALDDEHFIMYFGQMNALGRNPGILPEATHFQVVEIPLALESYFGG